MSRVLGTVLTHKLLVSVVLCFALLPQALAAYPKRTSSLMDLANILPARDQASLLESMAWFKRNTGGEMVVLTLPSWQALGTPDKTWESFSSNLFNRWGLGSAKRNDGVLFMAAIKERKLRIELGSGFSRCYDSTMKQILTNNVVPLFKETRYGVGMALGSKKIIQSLPKLCSTPSIKPQATYVMPPSSRGIQSSYTPLTPQLPWMTLGGIGLVFCALWYVLRPRAKVCPNCQAPLELLSEQADDEYLEPAARLEEILGSVNYRVYSCRRCNHHQIEPQRRWFSGYNNCPNCQRVTLKETKTALQHPTTRREGLALLQHHCQHCQHRSERQVLLPRLDEPDNNSSSSQRQSFVSLNSSLSSLSSSSSEPSSGGGRSSGGGASADW